MSKTCGTCRNHRNGDCHCPVPIAMDNGEHVLSQVNPTNPDRDASECTPYSPKPTPDPSTVEAGPRRQRALSLLSQLMKWAPDTTIDLRDDYSDALGVVDAVHEWIYRDDADEAKLLKDIVAAHEEYEDGQ